MSDVKPIDRPNISTEEYEEDMERMAIITINSARESGNCNHNYDKMA
jgi:hypothetical protein